MTFVPIYRPPVGGGGVTANWYVEAAEPTGVNDTAALAASLASAKALGADLQLRPGTYNLVTAGSSPARCITIDDTSTRIKVRGAGSTIQFDSRSTHGFIIEGGASEVSFEGVRFQGYTGTGDSDKTINGQAAFYVEDGVTDVSIVDCHFDHVQSAFFVSGDGSTRLTFSKNTVVDAPLALNPPSYAIVTDNFFQDVECYIDPVDGIPHSRSHAVYCFGRCVNLILTGNYFKNQSTATVEIRANDAPLLQKRSWIISNNVFENTSPLYGLYISSLGSEINVGTCVIANNIFRNSGGPMQLTGLRDAVITGNIMEFDYQYAFDPGCTGITLTSAFDSGETCVSKGCIISGNRIVNRHPFWAQVTISALPAQDDTITVGSVVYTWRNAANSSGQVQIGASVDDCADNLMSALQGKSFTLQNKVLRDNADCWKTNNETPAKLWIASLATFALSETGSGVTVSSVTDATGVLVTGIDVSNAIDTKIHDNSVEGCKGWNITSCVAPIVSANVVSAPYDGIGGIGRGNAWPVYENNHFVWNRRFQVPGLTSNQQMMSYDAFPIIRNCDLLAEQSGGASIRTLPWMTGQSGIVTAGDGFARQMFFYGREVSVGAPGARDFHWEDGDEIIIYNNGTGVSHTFTFKRTSPVQASKEFNSYQGLIDCINSQTSGSWTASNPVAAYYGSDGQAYGYILLVAGTIGTTRNGDEIEINQDKNGRTGPQTCGVYLKPWVTGGVYNNRNQAEFLGGAAEATKTAVFTPMATTTTLINVAGVDEASHALLPRVYQADVLPGVGFLITHGVASGTEKFAWSIS